MRYNAFLPTLGLGGGKNRQMSLAAVRKGLILSLIFIFNLLYMNNLRAGDIPDFAFPQKVEKSAKADLKKALASGNAPEVVNAVVRMSLARSIVNTDSLPGVLTQVEDVATTTDSPAAKAMLYALEAEIYFEIYRNDGWTYNRRAPLAQPSNDFTLWGRTEFLAKIKSLIELSLRDADQLRAIPLRDYAGVVDIQKDQAMFCPTLEDFLLYRGIEILKSMAEMSGENLRVLNPGLMEYPDSEVLFPGKSATPLAEILGLYARLVAATQSSSPAKFMAQAEQIDFINSYLFTPRGYYGSRVRNADGFSVSYEDVSSDKLLRSRMLQLYEENSQNEFAGVFLDRLAQTYSSENVTPDIYLKLQEYLKRFPDGKFAPNILNDLERVSEKRANVEFPAQVSPGKVVDVTVNVVNARNVELAFYNVTPNGNSQQAVVKRNDSRIDIPKGAKPYEVKTLEFDNAIPFVGQKSISCVFPEYGLYAVMVKIDGRKESDYTQLIQCSDLSLATTRVGTKQSAWVVDPVSGAPVEGATLSFAPWSRKNGLQTLPGTTDRDGRESIDIQEYGLLYADKGVDRYLRGISVSKPGELKESNELKAELFTSLGLYRPGDEVEFSLVAYRQSSTERFPAAAQRLAVQVLDANYQPVDTIVVTTDSWGRAAGSFTLPTAGLTGSFTLRAARTSGIRLNDYCGSKSFMVSDYKLPTFEVTSTDIERPENEHSGGKISGCAMTYSGFPVGDAQVKASMKVSTGYWWWRSESPVFFTAETATDSEGNFTIEIPATAISGAPSSHGLFIVDIDVTSPQGETRSMQSCFSLGKQYNIMVSIPSEINTTREVKVSAEVVDPSGNKVDIPLTFRIERDGETINKGDYSTAILANIISRLTTGSYTLKVAAADPSLADDAPDANFVVYRPDSRKCPVDAPLWVPAGNIETDAEGNGEFVLGSNCQDAYVRMLLSGYPDISIEQRWLSPKCGMQVVKFRLPEGVDRAVLSLSAVKDFQYYGYTMSVVRSNVRKALKMQIETFRDRVTPGSTERITLRVSPEGQTPALSAVMLDMSNKAIDILNPNPLNLPGFSPAGVRASASAWSFSKVSYSANVSGKYVEEVVLALPEYNLYGLNYMYGGIREMMTLRGSAQMMKNSVATYAFDAAESMSDLEESVEEESAAGAAEDNGASEESAESTSDTENFRSAEVPLAFFRPMLTTAEDGTLEIRYEVPNANTTWILRALAYNSQLLSASASAEIVSSKPVMVSLNAPRFLRTCDSLTLAASVVNNAEDERIVIVTAQALAASSGELLASRVDTLEMDSRTSAVVKLPLELPASATGVIFRVKATSGEFTDGESSLIPVLPSEQDVVESDIFYLAPDRSHFALSLPAMEDGDRAYLSFTENPSWQVVSALPGLRKSKINSAPEAAAALFSACVAEGILRDNPEIAKVLRHWLDNPGDSALVSELQKNTELKSMLLSATPWVSEALSDTERMQRLALLFDRRQTSAVIRESIDRLQKLSVDGGWAWTEAYPKVSLWATQRVMDLLGELNRMKYLPADQRLQKMITTACDYLDREAVEHKKEFPKADMWYYVSVRGDFPEVRRSAAATRLLNDQVQLCVARWRDVSVALKGIYAMILNNNGYNATARMVLASLREYATSTPERGMWWQQFDRYFFFEGYDRVGITSIMLDAFNSIEPGCEDVEKIRQWLILNKTNNDWGDAVMTTQAVAAILQSGKPLRVNTRGTAIHIGDELLEPTSPEYATGAFTADITGMLKSPASLTIDRQADYPSVGSVMTMRRLPASQVKAVGCKEISVQKSLSVFDGEAWRETSEFAVGDRVRVELILKVEDDMSYVVIEDLRAAAFEPVEQLPTPLISEGLYFYRENRDSQTNIFIDFLPRGTYRLAYEVYASQAGVFASGAAKVQSMYNPIIAAHSAGGEVKILND